MKRVGCFAAYMVKNAGKVDYPYAYRKIFYKEGGKLSLLYGFRDKDY